MRILTPLIVACALPLFVVPAVVAGDVAPEDVPRSSGATAAQRKYDNAVEQARQAYEKAVSDATQKLLAELKATQQVAMSRQDLDEANRIAAAIKRTQSASNSPPLPGAGAGAGAGPETPAAQDPARAGDRPADRKLTPEQAALVKGLQIGKVALPSRRGLTFFHLDVPIDNRSPQGRIEKQLSIEVRVLCVDADGKPNVTRYSKPIDIAAHGPQSVGLGGRVALQTIKTRNNNNEIPRNAYVAFRIDDVVFHETFLSPPARGERWWTDDALIVSKG